MLIIERQTKRIPQLFYFYRSRKQRFPDNCKHDGLEYLLTESRNHQKP